MLGAGRSGREFICWVLPWWQIFSHPGSRWSGIGESDSPCCYFGCLINGTKCIVFKHWSEVSKILKFKPKILLLYYMYIVMKKCNQKWLFDLRENRQNWHIQNAVIWHNVKLSLWDIIFGPKKDQVLDKRYVDFIQIVFRVISVGNWSFSQLIKRIVLMVCPANTSTSELEHMFTSYEGRMEEPPSLIGILHYIRSQFPQSP